VYKKCFKFVFEFITNLKSSFKYFNKDRIVGYQLWGTFDPQKLLDKGDNYFSKLCNDLKAEKAHMKFCKFSLGVGKRSFM
jgi:hypothetical protein